MKKFFIKLISVAFFSTSITTVRALNETELLIYSAIGGTFTSAITYIANQSHTDNKGSLVIISAGSGILMGGLIYGLSYHLTSEAKCRKALITINRLSNATFIRTFNNDERFFAHVSSYCNSRFPLAEARSYYLTALEDLHQAELFLTNSCNESTNQQLLAKIAEFSQKIPAIKRHLNSLISALESHPDYKNQVLLLNADEREKARNEQEANRKLRALERELDREVEDFAQTIK